MMIHISLKRGIIIWITEEDCVNFEKTVTIHRAKLESFWINLNKVIITLKQVVRN